MPQPTYTCPTCLKTFDRKYNFDRHQKRKIPCRSALGSLKKLIDGRKISELKKLIDELSLQTQPTESA